ncbi:MAG: acyl--CoA ligase [Caulobacteraceae bacterium]|nr:acyl--CoA ligase [Caulobacteraceae bacterium]
MPSPPAYSGTIPEALARSAVFGERDFIVDGDRRLTFREADAASRRLARRLLAAGAGKGTRIGLRFANGAEFILCWLAVCRIGAIAVTLSTLYKPPELAAVLRRSDVQFLLTNASLLGVDATQALENALPELSRAAGPDLRLQEAPYLRRIFVFGASGAPWATPISLDDETPDADDALLDAIEKQVVASDHAILIFTSGTSAEPKGVLHTQATMLRQGIDLLARDGTPHRCLAVAPFFWVAGLTAVASALQQGAALITLEKLDPERGLELAERERVSFVHIWPSLFERFRKHPSFATRDLSSIPDLAAATPPMATKEEPTSNLGMTETMGSHVGQTNVERKLIDPETGQTVRDGEIGEISVRGPGVMVGYYKADREAVFDRDGWFRTGDLALTRGADLYFQGRRNELIKVDGANVSPLEVEQALLQESRVTAAFVFGLDDAERGQIVGAVVVVQPEADLEAETLARAAAGRLSSYKAPRRLLLLTGDETPTLPSGKPDKRQLRQMLEQKGVRVLS